MTAGDNNQHVSIEDLSAYADNEALTMDQRASIEHHLSGCHACRDELASLQTVSALLADLPEVEAPRSFRLTPADVGIDAPRTVEPVPIEPWIIRNQSRFRWAGLAAAVLLIMVVTADIFSTTNGDDAVSDLTFMEDAAEESAPAESDMDEEQSIMSVDEAEEADEPAADVAAPETEEADEPASEEAAPDAALDGESAEEEEFSVTEDAPEPEEGRQDQPAMDSAPEDVAGTDDPVADSAVEEELARMQAADEADGGLSLLQWTGIVLALLTVALLGAGFLLPHVWPAFSRSGR